MTLPIAARFAAGFIGILAWFGVAIQFMATLEQNGSFVMTAWILLRYFTIIANMLLGFVMIGVLKGGAKAGTPFVLGGVTATIALVGVVHFLLLRGLLELSGGQLLADTLLHRVTPVLAVLFWLLLAPRGGLTRRDPWLWALLPLAYFVYALVRGSFEGAFAYPFLNLAKNGWATTIAYAAAMAFGFVLAGHGFVGLDGALARRGR